MTYREYFEAHKDENLSWCKPYFDKSGEYCIVMYDGGEPLSVVTPNREAHRYEESLDSLVTEVAKAVNPDYDDHSGWSDLHIALDAMHECGCTSCPFKDDCEAMGEEMQETDYR